MRALRLFLFVLLAATTVARGAITGGPSGPGGTGVPGQLATNTLAPVALIPNSPTNRAPNGLVLTPGVGITFTTNNATNLVVTSTGTNVAIVTNAQPPSENLTNWSTVSTNAALMVGKTVFVSTNGNNATGARTWRHLPFASPIWAKTNAQAGDTVVVFPGEYDAHSLAKNGVNWEFLPGAVITNNGAIPTWHDLGIGAVTSIIHGGAFKHTFTSEVVRITNSATIIDFKGLDDIWQASTSNSWAAIKQTRGKLTVDGLSRGRCDGYDFWWVDGDATRSIFRGNHVAAKDTIFEIQHNFTQWGDAYFEFNTAEQLGAGTSQFIVLGDKSHVKGGSAKLAPASQITTLAEATEGGIIEIAVIEAATNATVSPILAGDDLLGGGIWIKNSRIIGPTFGNVPPITLFTVAGIAPVVLENVSLVAGSSSTYTMEGDSGNTVKIVGTLQANKLIEQVIDVQEGNIQQTDQLEVLSLNLQERLVYGAQAEPTLTVDNTSILPSKSWIRLASDTTTASSRTFNFNDLVEEGTYVILEWTDAVNRGELLDNSANAINGFNRLEGDWRPEQYDIIMLYFNGTDFIESGRASAGGGGLADRPYINYTNGFGTNTTFYGNGVSAASATNIAVIGAWNETDELFTAVGINVTDSGDAIDDSALLRLRFDPGGARNVNWLSATNANSGATWRVFSDGSSYQSGNASVRGTVSATNLVVTNRVVHGVKALTYSGTNVTVDWSQGVHFYLRLTNNAKLWFTNAPGLNFGQTGLIDFEQDGSGNRLLYWDTTNIRTNPANPIVLSTTASSFDDMHVKTYGLTGTNFHILLNTGWAK